MALIFYLNFYGMHLKYGLKFVVIEIYRLKYLVYLVDDCPFIPLFILDLFSLCVFEWFLNFEMELCTLFQRFTFFIHLVYH